MSKVDVLMPMLGEGITEGTIVKWWKKPGDYVKKEETLLEISTDKVDSEIPSPYEGKVVELIAAENETVAVENVIAIIETDSAEASEESKPEKPQPAASKEEKKPPQPEAKKAPESKPAKAAAASTNGNMLEVEMPMLGEGITEGTIVKWWKKPGDKIKKDETLLEISTDKVDSEIPSPFDGTVEELLAEENETVEVGKIIAKIQSSQGGEAAAEKTAEKAPAESAPTEKGRKPAVQTPSPAAETIERIPAREDGGRFYSPLVRSIARKEGVSKEELSQISGSGLEGRVTKNDILQYLETRTAAPKAVPTEKRKEAPAAKPAAPAPAVRQPAPSREEVSAKWQGEPVEVVPMDAIRKKIADHMVMSKHTSPHVYGVAECDFTPIMNIVAKNKTAFQEREGFKLTINPFILFSLVKAVKDFPDVNCSIEGYNVIKKKYVNIGMAVATERGLIVPVLKNADELNFTGIARNAYDLAIRARDRKLNLEDVQGSTITVTNYGVFGNIIGFPIINQPNVAIMGVGAVKKRPVVLETEQGDMLGIRSIGFLTLSYDHRTVDGELGDKYLQRVRYYIENFQEGWM